MTKDESMKITTPYGRISNNKEQSYLNGDVVTKHGIVSVYSQGYCGNYTKHTRLDFSLKGTLHIRSINKCYSARYLITLADKFANEMILKH